jgi:hypothetical protein
MATTRTVPVTLCHAGLRQFHAAVSFKGVEGVIVSGSGKTRKTAIRAMETELRKHYTGTLPTWEVREFKARIPDAVANETSGLDPER